MLDKAYDPKPVEDARRAEWRDAKLFHSEPREGGRAFAVVIPPPNVTGALHMGHALNNALQDIFVRWRRLHGEEACWVPGTDHGGIATQNVMEKQLKAEGKTRYDLGRERFLERMQAWTRDCKRIILGQLDRLGCALDWEREAFTMDEARARSVFAAFKALWERGLIYRGERMVNWCVRCGTALSDIEVEHEERKGHLWHIHYPLSDSSEGLVVATTRPETMLGDTAVAVNPKDERYARLVGKTLKLPLAGREIPVVADEQVDSAFGTGAVKVTPAHDPNDYEIGQRHKLPAIKVIGADGKMTKEAGEHFEKLSREEARKKVVEALEASALLRKTEDHRHSVGVCYRCSSVIEPLLSSQWFLNQRKLAVKPLAAVKDGSFKLHPDSWKKPYVEWLEGIKDWCISRQIWWGHRIPVWYCLQCVNPAVFLRPGLKLKSGPNAGFEPSESHGAADLLEGGLVRDEIDEHAKGYDFKAAAEVDSARGLKGLKVSEAEPGPCEHCGKSAWVQDRDVLDTWFSSALWPMSVFGWPDKTKDLAFYYPTSVLVTGYEILYLWVARMQMMGLEFLGKVPFSDAVIHGIVRDKSGKKMSKSLGNVVDPLEMMDKFGTDALRFSLAVQAYPGKDIPFSPDSITGSKNFANKLWNSTRFVLMNLPEAPSKPYRVEDLSQSRLELADRWILAEYQNALRLSRDRMAAWDAAGAADILYGFVWDKFCDWYVELAKLRLQGPDGEEKESARAILTVVANGVLKLLHPFMPYITEELFRALRPYTGETEDFVLEAEAPELDSDWRSPEVVLEMRSVMKVVTAIRTLRAQLNVPPALKIRVIGSGGAPEGRETIRKHQDYLKALARVEELTLEPRAERPPHSATAVAGGISFFVPLEGVIDFAREKERLRKEMTRAEDEVRKISQKVSNKDFLARAPESEVSLARVQHEAALSRQAKLKETLEILDGG